MKGGFPMRYKLYWLLILAFCLPLLLTGVSSTQAKDAKVITLRAADFYPPGHPIEVGFLKGWKTMLEERTKAIGHPVEIKYFGHQSLIKAGDIIDATRSGVSDLGNAVYIGKYLPIVYFLQIPGMIKDDDVVKATAAIQEVSKKIIDPYYEKMGLKALYPLGGSTQYQLAGKGDPRNTLDGIKGLKVRVAGKLLPNSARALGMKPVSMVMGEVYEALERGVVDTVSLQVASYTHYAFFEMIDWALLNLNLGQYGVVSWVMNLKTYNSLPAEVQAVIEEIALDAAHFSVQFTYDRMKHDLEEVWPKKGVKLVYLSKEDVAKKNKLLAPVGKKWLQDMEKKGYPMKKLMTVWEEALAKKGMSLPKGTNPYK
jgi:TRAP-type C4-dicarboxylate transport system substrate-binding protein